MSQNFKILRERLLELIIYLKVHFTFGFHLSINTGTWNTNLALSDKIFGWWRNHGISKLQNFEIAVFKNKYFTSNFDFLLNFTFLSQSVHEIQVWVFFYPLFDKWRHHRRLNCNILRKWSQKQTLTSKFHQRLIQNFLSPSIHDKQLLVFLPNLEIITSQRK